MAWCQKGDKPLSGPMLTRFTDAYICGTRGRWVNNIFLIQSNLLTFFFKIPTQDIPYLTCEGQGPDSILEQLERLRSEDTPRRLMITHTIESCWIPSQNKVEWSWRYRSRTKVVTCDTPSHANDLLYQIWKESIQNCRRYRADPIFKVKAEWPWKYRSRSKRSLHGTHPLMLMMICAKYGKNASRIVDFFQGESRKIRKFLEFCYKLNTWHTL